MKYLRWLPIVLCLLLIALMGAAVVYGRTLPATPSGAVQAAGLDVCGGNLCLFHVAPGTTSYNEAKQALAKQITRDEEDHFHGQVGELALRVAMDSTGLQVGEIEVQGYNTSASTGAIRLGALIEQFGAPCYVADVRPGDGGIDLAFPSFRVWVLPDQAHITLGSPIGGFIMTSGDNTSASNRSCGNATDGIAWHGFASLQSYQASLWDGRERPLSEGYSYPSYPAYPRSVNPGNRPPYGP